MYSEIMGTVFLKVYDEHGNASEIDLIDVLYVPRLKVNLMSITRVVVYGKATVIHLDTMMHIKPSGIDSETVAVGRYDSKLKLFVLDCSVLLLDDEKCLLATEKGSLHYGELIYKRLGHIGANKLKTLHTTTQGVKQIPKMKAHS